MHLFSSQIISPRNRWSFPPPTSYDLFSRAEEEVKKNHNAIEGAKNTLNEIAVLLEKTGEKIAKEEAICNSWRHQNVFNRVSLTASKNSLWTCRILTVNNASVKIGSCFNIQLIKNIFKSKIYLKSNKASNKSYQKYLIFILYEFRTSSSARLIFSGLYIASRLQQLLIHIWSYTFTNYFLRKFNIYIFFS